MPSIIPLDVPSLPEQVDISGSGGALDVVREVVRRGPFRDSWDSLREYQVPRWYRDAKFGVFIHWGLYSVPAFRNEWYPRNMYLDGTEEFQHHLQTYGPQASFGYKDFIPSFQMENFDPDEWAVLFRRAGAQFAVPVAEHHDGFTMYDSGRTRWSAARMGPKRDVFGELLTSMDRAWIIRGASSHRAEHWFFMNGGARFDSDVLDPRFLDFYGPAQREETAPNDLYLQDWLLRSVEIIDKYRPQIFWFDWWIEQPAFQPYLKLFASYYYNRAVEWGVQVAINYKWDAFEAGTAVYDVERGTVAAVRSEPWQSDTSVSRTSWCWIGNHDYKSVAELIAELVDTVSKNGNLLLNIGPKPDGTIAPEEQSLLEGIGRWLAINGEAIFGSRPWLIAGEGPARAKAGSFVDSTVPAFTSEDIRFTSRADVTGDYLYATVLAPPREGLVRIRSFGRGAGLLNREIREVAVLGVLGPPQWSQEDAFLAVRVPNAPGSFGGPVVKLFLEPVAGQRRTDFLHG